MGYKYFEISPIEVLPMKRESFFVALFCMGILWVMLAFPLHAQNPPKNLTLLYGNNFNGEIEPCPT